MSIPERRCANCNEKLGEKMNYCPTCGKMYKRYWKSYYRPGLVVANIIFLGVAIWILLYLGFSTHDPNKDVAYDAFISFATAIIPTTLITILNATILFREHRDKVQEDSKVLKIS